ncbi:unnamed protein product [Macrosiphum euphorbiae]|uniref:Endonuclease/exonuclease/phosphatase domain-containing protein n=1 Tax=Macrosiphum euphorbiae TaxID=13131 RepID=A0AAV0WRD8_9HEMI|nr:unnamed protein product [Macrosiphum euphorbiae]
MQKQPLRIVQLNMNGQFIVAEQLRDYFINKKVDIALVQEPPSRGGCIPGLENIPIRTITGADSEAGAAIIVFNPNLSINYQKKYSRRHSQTEKQKSQNIYFGVL